MAPTGMKNASSAPSVGKLSGLAVLFQKMMSSTVPDAIRIYMPSVARIAESHSPKAASSTTNRPGTRSVSVVLPAMNRWHLDHSLCIVATATVSSAMEGSWPSSVRSALNQLSAVNTSR